MRRIRNSFSQTAAILPVCALLFAVAAGPAHAASHSWAPVEVYSDDTGTIQYVKLHCPAGSANETGIATRYLKAELSGNQTPNYGVNLPAGSTSDTTLLYATAGFAALPGAPTPDAIMADNFVDTNAELIRWWEYTFAWSTMSYGPGDLPTGGSVSLHWDGSVLFTAPANPTNFARVGFAPPGVQNLLVGKTVSDGSQLELTWDDSGCLGGQLFQIAYGYGSQLPTLFGDPYGLQPESVAEQCNIAGSPDTWAGVPDPAVDPTRMIWFTLRAEDGQTTEGSLGANTGGERTGPGSGGATGQCGNLTKSLLNTCGQ